MVPRTELAGARIPLHRICGAVWGIGGEWNFEERCGCVGKSRNLRGWSVVCALVSHGVLPLPYGSAVIKKKKKKRLMMVFGLRG